MLATDIIKIKYSEEGYLPSYPPHLISDEEMCEAFLTREYAYFYDTYPLIADSLIDAYHILVNAIRYHIARFLSTVESFKQDLPDWVYSYMLGEVVNDSSVQEDRHFLLVGINRDNKEDELNEAAQLQCYQVSKQWVSKLDREIRIAKLETLLSQYTESEQAIIKKEFNKWGVRFPEAFGEWDVKFTGISKYSSISKETIDAIVNHDWVKPAFQEPESITLDMIQRIMDEEVGTSSEYRITNANIDLILNHQWSPDYILIRPPTMFGEPDIIKLIRLNEVVI